MVGYRIILALSLIDLTAAIYWRLVVGEFAYGFDDPVPNMPHPNPSRNLAGSYILWTSLGLVMGSVACWIITRERRWAWPLLASMVALAVITSANRYTV